MELGNASSLPSRLPYLSPVLRNLRDVSHDKKIKYSIVCCSYRGYWTSNGRPSERGLALDAQAALRWIEEQKHSRSKLVSVVIWGQSIGAGVATRLAAEQARFAHHIRLNALVLETPFLSVRAMLETIYPQRWLPYRYLWPFLRNHLDSWKALGILAERCKELDITRPRILILEAGKDELVPSSHGETLERRCLNLGLVVRKQVIDGALHTEIMTRQQGRLAVVAAVQAACK